MIHPRCALPGVFALALMCAAAGCESAPAANNEELHQAVAELRSDVAALKRTVARLEQELAEAKAPPAAAKTEAKPAAATKTVCTGTTSSGARCKRSAREGSRFCWQHAGQ